MSTMTMVCLVILVVMFGYLFASAVREQRALARDPKARQAFLFEGFMVSP